MKRQMWSQSNFCAFSILSTNRTRYHPLASSCRGCLKTTWWRTSACTVSKHINYKFSPPSRMSCAAWKPFFLARCAALSLRGVRIYLLWKTCNYERKLRSACGDVYLWACRFENLWIIKASRANDQLCYSGRRARGWKERRGETNNGEITILATPRRCSVSLSLQYC
jgi:hypothetical protein